MAVEKVANNPLGSYPVLVDRNTAGSDIQVMRLDMGVGTAEDRVTSANPLPTSISGTIPLPSGAATAANQTSEIAALQNISGGVTTDGFFTGNNVFHTGIYSSGASDWIGWDGAVSQSGVTWLVQNQDGAGNNLTSATSAPAGTERGLHVRQVGTVAATQSGTWNIGSITTLPALPANQSVNCAQMNGVAVTMGNGASGTGVQRVTIASDSTGQVIALGNVAHDAADSGNPVKVGFKARTSDPTAVANDDRVNALADKRGRQVVAVNSLQENKFGGTNATAITNTTSTQIVPAGGAGVIYIPTLISVSNMSATVSTRVSILDGSTVIFQGPASSGGGGFVATIADIPSCTANTALNAQCETTGASVKVTILGWKTT